MDVEIKYDDREVQRALNRLIAAGGDLTPAMREIAGHLADSVADSFDLERAPDGAPWKPIKEKTKRDRRRQGLPRTRGDGPPGYSLSDEGREASPHTRGWTASDEPVVTTRRGFPAHAGMDPRPDAHRPGDRRLPRTRGDGPTPTPTSPSPPMASPHTRGWTLPGVEAEAGDEGFPAHAGMDLLLSPRREPLKKGDLYRKKTRGVHRLRGSKMSPPAAPPDRPTSYGYFTGQAAVSTNFLGQRRRFNTSTSATAESARAEGGRHARCTTRRSSGQGLGRFRSLRRRCAPQRPSRERPDS